MKFNKVVVLLSCSSLWLIAKSKSSYAFDFRPVITYDSSYLNGDSFCDSGNSQKYCSSYSVQQSGWGTLTVKASKLELLPPPKSDSSILQVLQSSPWANVAQPPLQPWSFESSNKSLDGFLEILKYKPIVSYGNTVKGFVSGEDPFVQPQFPPTGYIGGYLSAVFYPQGNDPIPLGANNPNNKFHWIQAISSNAGGVIYGFNQNKSIIAYGRQDKNKIDVIEEQKDPRYVIPNSGIDATNKKEIENGS
jgi:hypothetical protein